MKNLSQNQENLIKSTYPNFATTEGFKKEAEGRKARSEFVMQLLKQDKLGNMSEVEFGELYSQLWASDIWKNKDYQIKRLIAANGIDEIKKQLNDLLYGEGDFYERFDKFNIKGLGPAAITEILCLFNPTEFGIWNTKARKAFKILGFDWLPLDTYKISGKDYREINRAIKLIAGKLKELGWTDVDLLGVDYFLYWLAYHAEVEEGKVVADVVEFDHDEVRDYIDEIGQLLGFQTDIEKRIERGAQVDVIWRARIANLGEVTYVFEVHKTGSIDSLILNLQRAQNDPTVQKIIAVSNEQQLEQIRNEIESLPENFRRALVFWNVSEVFDTYEKLSDAMGNIAKLGLVQG